LSLIPGRRGSGSGKKCRLGGSEQRIGSDRRFDPDPDQVPKLNGGVDARNEETKEAKRRAEIREAKLKCTTIR
jgi:hypothetical protein